MHFWETSGSSSTRRDAGDLKRSFSWRSFFREPYFEYFFIFVLWVLNYRNLWD